ncbi:MAG: fatty acid desaturase family protein [Chitinophagales bacterium]|nr:fatty acid desaturase family protein [Chitinophagales bacterium]
MRVLDENIRSLSKLNQLKSLFIVLFEWVIIISCFLLFIFLKPISYYLLPIFIFVIGTRMYAFYSLIHDGIHYLLCKNKILNDWVVRLFLAWPIFISLQKMRNNHFSHHKNFLTDKDPEFQLSRYAEFQFPLKKRTFIGILLGDLSGYNFLKYKLYGCLKNPNERLWIVGLLLAIFMFYYFSDNTILQVIIFLWIVPYITVFQTLNRLRAYTEHFNLPEGVQTRSLIISPFLSFFFTPYSLGYHEVHHMYPYIPQYNLRTLHDYVLERGENLYEEKSLFRLIKFIYR